MEYPGISNYNVFFLKIHIEANMRDVCTTRRVMDMWRIFLWLNRKPFYVARTVFTSLRGFGPQ